MYVVLLGLIRKPAVDFQFLYLLVIGLIELFSARCHGSGTTSEHRLEVGVSEGVGHGAKISGRSGRPHQPFFVLGKLE